MDFTAGVDTDLGLASLPGEEAFFTGCCDHTCSSNPTTSRVAWSELLALSGSQNPHLLPGEGLPLAAFLFSKL